MNTTKRTEIPLLKIELERTKKLPQAIIADLLDEITDLRAIQAMTEKLLSVKFSITLPSTGKGVIFAVLQRTRNTVSAYWQNRRKTPDGS